MNNREIALTAARTLINKKALDVIAIDVTDKSSFTDYLVIASGGSERQVGTLAKEVEEHLALIGISPKNVEGKRSSGWVLLDYGDVIINIFSIEQRNRYNLEKVWGDGSYLDIE
ncbi:MAG: ribosome silencing factor [Eubacteriales bacterium]|nr:ribosome silencing factor [Eubacteriales bacterium]MDD4582767.1 ribosome silencing factor [Eubacteriales bacterium]